MCRDLHQLIQFFESTGAALPRQDVIRRTCHRCQKREVCPSTTTRELAHPTDASWVCGIPQGSSLS